MPEASRVEIEFDYWMAGTFRRGRILGQLWFSSRASALEAAGLRE